MDDVTRRRVCELVMGIIATDHELHPDELTYMLKIFKAFGVATGADDEALTPTTRSFEAAKAMSNLPEEVRNETLDLLLDSAVADGKVVEAEREYLKAVARAARVPEDELERRLAAKLAAFTGGSA